MIHNIQKGFYLNSTVPEVIIEVLEVIKEYKDKVHCIVAVRNKVNGELIKEGPMYILKDNYKHWFYNFHG